MNGNIVYFQAPCAPIPASTSSSTVDDNNNNPSAKRKRDPQSDNLEDRVASLEKSAKVEAVKELKEKVRALCLQHEPSNPLILLTLEELAKTARRVDHEESDVFDIVVN